MRKVQDGESRGRCRIERKRMVQVRESRRRFRTEKVKEGSG